MNAALFPGQGVDPPSPLEHPLMRLAGELTGLDPARVLRQGGARLFRTEVWQPLLVAASLAAFEALEVEIGAVAGHSLGELAAWSAAGGVAPEDAVRLARTRGLLMAEVARRHPGGMVVSRSPVPPPGAALAAHNAPDTWVFSGPTEALRGHGNPLPVSGPWHHPCMAEAAGAFAEALDRLPRRPLQRTFVSNHTGQPAGADQIPALLTRQLSAPVRWVECLGALRDLGTTEVHICGPGRELAQLARACVPGWRIHR